MSSEQWLSDGECNKCRKQKYCSKQCTANKVALRNLMKSTLIKAIAKGMKQKKEQDQKEYIDDLQ